MIAAAGEICPEEINLSLLAFKQEPLLEELTLGETSILKIPGKLFQVFFYNHFFPKETHFENIHNVII